MEKDTIVIKEIKETIDIFEQLKIGEMGHSGWKKPIDKHYLINNLYYRDKNEVRSMSVDLSIMELMELTEGKIIGEEIAIYIMNKSPRVKKTIKKLKNGEGKLL